MTLTFVKPPQTRRANILLYGPPKTGKSIAAGGAPGEILYGNGDTENALTEVHCRYGERIHEVRMGGPDPMKPTALNAMVDIHGLVTNGEGTFNTVALDPLSDVRRLFLEQISGRSLNPQIAHYGQADTHLERFCRMLCDAPVNTILVAHELKVGEGEDTRWLPFTGSQSNPGLGLKIASMVDVIAYTGIIRAEDGEERYVAQLVEGRGRLGGDRFNVIREDKSIPYTTLDLAAWFERINNRPGATGEKEKS